MIKVIEMFGGRTVSAETKEDAAAFLKLSDALKTFDPKLATKKQRKKIRSAWIGVERRMTHKLQRTAGIDREDVF